MLHSKHSKAINVFIKPVYFDYKYIYYDYNGIKNAYPIKISYKTPSVYLNGIYFKVPMLALDPQSSSINADTLTRGISIKLDNDPYNWRHMHRYKPYANHKAVLNVNLEKHPAYINLVHNLHMIDQSIRKNIFKAETTMLHNNINYNDIIQLSKEDRLLQQNRNRCIKVTNGYDPIFPVIIEPILTKHNNIIKIYGFVNMPTEVPTSIITVENIKGLSITQIDSRDGVYIPCVKFHLHNY